MNVTRTLDEVESGLRGKNCSSLPSAIDPLSLEERIRRRAYELYIERGSQSGLDLDDWLQAEEEILGAEVDARIDESSEESFPASDSPGY